ncbi:MAG: RdgB/HAM1 family non-canonical purine NTP pyrophosphatase [Candidatus Thalassarchaeaceae archaeon]|jgi:XTP/dITP diphosphohydrolase|nr:non-canonical purine NTP pyrophosphatase, RdgB/HAM1 family [Euryarchaeota archaeon]MDP7091780.1 RdgB/HAM1 family non-canonical purine NTP pyrophosphatase [Candidatus Thalassarchaeaceae archaeon]MBV43897.1 non-canonical purine NTP pyrophosphatase, RdgB/HAM1 family [Euryarchaeota archaeon]MDP7257343.1 RdgB/HAM1 family non-canonical purine NTP pyrophosphatase [Candidatus Thalassarchaeaceae archaeon]MDP7446697.1 RdgB/HAM1 family non-canonical purine NTP pyrophosphatase [Candidatus Thalassarchaea|tara:strand:- start:870 stop:1463 length:594 start_codon:yes stop_codon:yes gene_type:complete
MEILFATGNEHKVAEAAALFEPLGHNVKALVVDGESPEFVEPQANGLEEVARAKIEQARSMVIGTPLADSAILVEDSGLFIHALGGFPGVYSSYVERSLGLGGVLRLLDGSDYRGAEYRAVAIIDLGDRTLRASGVCRGGIAEERRGDGGFGYDPIFIPEEGDGRTFGQMSADEKSALSHRGRALKGLSEPHKSPSK